MGTLRFTSQILGQGVLSGGATANLTALANLTNVSSDLYESGSLASHYGNMSYATSGYSASLWGLFVYQGTPMTQAELDAVTYQTDITKSPRYSDLLVSCPATFLPSTASNYLATPTFLPKASVPIQAGTATWALLGEWGVNPFLCLLSITEVGGGGDLELQSTNIQEGVPYLFGGITLTPKLSFSW
jgi:hypothetical protein